MVTWKRGELARSKKPHLVVCVVDENTNFYKKVAEMEIHHRNKGIGWTCCPFVSLELLSNLRSHLVEWIG